MFEHRKSEEFLELVRSEMSALDDDIPEPDWAEFRSSVRDKLLARSMQRTSAVRRWKLAWAFSSIAVIAITTGLFWTTKFGNDGPDPMLRNYVESVPQSIVELPVWSQTALFDDLVQLGDNEEEQLRQMLEAAQ